jgi:ribonuclease HI
MELLAVIRGLEALDGPCRVRLVTDSTYVAQGIKEWLPRWKRQGWRRQSSGRGCAIKNIDLWQRLDRRLSIHNVTPERIKGHAGHPENERCDLLAQQAAQQCIQVPA